jgi:DNA-binding MarR family transcriptional regulator
MNDAVSVVDAETHERADEVMFALLIAAERLQARIEKALGAFGLSLAKLNVLSRMAEAGEPLALSEIASRLKCVRSNVTQLIDRLESDGLVRREADSGDRRSILAVLTDEGRERQGTGAAELARVNAEFAQTLPAADRVALQRALGLLT